MIGLTQSGKRQFRRRHFVTTSALALMGMIAPVSAAWAQSASNDDTGAGDIVVTASRREETVSKLPFTISAYGGEQLERANVTSIAELTRQVANFNIQDNGPRTSQGAIPIIRGLNASAPTTAASRYFQSPVGFYLGNAPITGSFPLFDIQRVEVLRGPQGTLYGAGSLSGAVRIVPIAPVMGKFEGVASVWGELVSHSKDQTYGAQGAINIPVSENLALRVNGRYEREAGFIDYHDVFKRTNNDYVSGAPVLANPTDVANSPGVYFDDPDGNFTKTVSARAALRWQPTAELEVQLAYNYAHAEGRGSYTDNPTFTGGPSPLDPRQTLRPTGEYERSLPTLEPWSRRTQLATLDASYDLGFATLATTLAYGKTKGEVTNDSTVALLGVPYGVYYTGSPSNPRIVIPGGNPDTDRSFTEEVRLVSAKGGTFDYSIGAFFQQQRRDIGLHIYAPGADVQSAAAHGGSTVPIVLGGTYVPLRAGDNAAYIQDAVQHFEDYSAYADLTWHVTDRWQVTGGVRFFHQKFEQRLTALSTLFLFQLDNSTANTTNSQIFKANTSYQLDDKNQVYATFSQGYRRGGANSFPLQGPVLEPHALLNYVPDRTNNYEIGLKGTMSRIYYSIAAFYIDWNKPQIDTTTPFNLNPVVINGGKATSKGFEAELSGPIGTTGLSFNLGLAYAKARLTEGYSLPAGSGGGTVVQNAIVGIAGDRLPGAPDWSGAANIAYATSLGASTKGSVNFGMDFRSNRDVEVRTPNVDTNQGIPGYALFNTSLVVERGKWKAELYSTNLLDKRVRLSAQNRNRTSLLRTGTWGNSYAVSKPREAGLRLSFAW